MNFHEVVKHEVQRDGMRVHFDLLAEGIGEPAEAADVHPHREVLSLYHFLRHSEFWPTCPNERDSSISTETELSFLLRFRNSQQYCFAFVTEVAWGMPL
jgi:hypothetical protein